MTHIPKKITFGVIALIGLFIIIASYWYKGQRKAEAVSSVPVVIDKKIAPVGVIVKKTSTYTIDVIYPHVTENLPGSQEANDYFKNFFSVKSDQFVIEVGESMANTNLPDEMKKSSSSYYNVSTSIVSTSTRYISFLVTSEKYSVGQAHPTHDIDTFIFDINNKKIVLPSELFAVTSSYLTSLSKLSIANFVIKNKNSDPDDIKIDTSSTNEGFSPIVENFSRILPTKDGLIIYFGEYQIAHYVAGPQETLIAYSLLQKIINKDGVIGEYRK